MLWSCQDTFPPAAQQLHSSEAASGPQGYGPCSSTPWMPSGLGGLEPSGEAALNPQEAQGCSHCSGEPPNLLLSPTSPAVSPLHFLELVLGRSLGGLPLPPPPPSLSYLPEDFLTPVPLTTKPRAKAPGQPGGPQKSWSPLQDMDHPQGTPGGALNYYCAKYIPSFFLLHITTAWPAVRVTPYGYMSCFYQI